MFSCKAGSLPSELSPIMGPTEVVPSFACRYYTMVKVNGSGKHSSFLQYGTITTVKRFLMGLRVILAVSATNKYIKRSSLFIWSDDNKENKILRS
jgi:hypothetical protein